MEIEIDETSGTARIAGTSYTPEELLGLVGKLTHAAAQLRPQIRDAQGEPSFVLNLPFVTHDWPVDDGLPLFSLSWLLQPFGRVGINLPLLGAAELGERVSAYLSRTMAVAFAQQEAAAAAKAGLSQQ